MKSKYIYERIKKGVLYYELRIRMQRQGQKYALNKSFDTLQEAVDARDDFLSNIETRQDIAIKKAREASIRTILNANFEVAITDWFRYDKAPYLAIQSRDKAAYLIAAKLIPAFSCYSISEITHEAVQAFLRNLQCQGEKILSVSYCAKIISVLHDFCEFLIRKGVLHANPCDNLKYVDKPRKKKDIFTASEIQKVLGYIKTKRYIRYVLYSTYFATGCRRAELLGLSWRYVDFSNKTIEISQVLIYDGKEKIQKIKTVPKNAFSARVIPLSAELMYKLGILRETQKILGVYSPDQLVFREKPGRPTLEQVTDYFSAVCKHVGINKHVSLHSTRHTITTRLVKDNVPINIVKAVGGWSNSRTIMDVYANHVTIDEMRSALKVGGKISKNSC